MSELEEVLDFPRGRARWATLYRANLDGKVRRFRVMDRSEAHRAVAALRNVATYHGRKIQAQYSDGYVYFRVFTS